MKIKYLNIANLSITLICFLALFTSSAQAKLVTEIIKVPVSVANLYGKITERDVVVTLLHDDAFIKASGKPHPIAIINHGRAAKPEERTTAFGRANSIVNARWLAGMGFLVAVPTRIGYGVTGGEDLEDTGLCNKKNYPPGYKAGIDQTLQILQTLRQRPNIAPDGGLILGQSFGGTIAIGVAAQNPAGILATLNFAGGGGGNPETNPMQPCGTANLEQMFSNYGKTAKIPTLWVYTENDQWMGPKYPKEWFEAYKAKSGTGEFLFLPPNGTDGHGVFSRDPAAWRPQVMQFLKSNGFPDLKETEANK
jgi:dienelactone hydrolase